MNGQAEVESIAPDTDDGPSLPRYQRTIAPEELDRFRAAFVVANAFTASLNDDELDALIVGIDGAGDDAVLAEMKKRCPR